MQELDRREPLPARRMRKADNPALRAEIEALRRAGQPLNRAEIAARHGVGVGTVQAARAEIDRALALTIGHSNGHSNGNPVQPPPARQAGGRTVAEFDGRRLLEARKRNLLLQEELAAKAGISRGEIGHLERCRRKPTLRTLRRLARALKIDASELLAGPEKPGTGTG